MSQAERPYLTRRLAGVDQALGEGRARQPVELLDQLRERLERLDPSHPSANPGFADLDEAQGREAAAEPAEAEQDSDPDRPSMRKEGPDSSPDDQAGDQAGDQSPGQPAADRRAGEPLASAVVDGAATGVADGGNYQMVQIDRMGKGEPYRPWFAGEPDAPWFVDPWFIE